MSIEKAEIRAAIVQELGSKVENIFEGSRAAAHQAEGARDALHEAARAVQQLHASVDEHANSKLLSPDEAQIAKDWITRAVMVVEQLAINARRQAIAQQGHAQGIAFVVQALKRAHDDELRVAATQRARDVEVEHRSIKEERIEEALQELASAPGSPAAADRTNGASESQTRQGKAVDTDGADA